MNARVLCIEDDQDIALAVSMVLRRAGFDIVGATDGKEGLRSFHAERPDVVLLDLGLPTLDGADAERVPAAGRPHPARWTDSLGRSAT
jgi:DNA-binding response OmpR family regulator